MHTPRLARDLRKNRYHACLDSPPEIERCSPCPGALPTALHSATGRRRPFRSRVVQDGTEARLRVRRQLFAVGKATGCASGACRILACHPSWTTRLIAADRRVQLSSSFSNCRRPDLVREENLAMRPVSVLRHSAVIQACCSRRCRAGYKDPC